MNIFTKVASWISSIGENQNFIAFMAHAGATYFVISNFGHTNHWVIWTTLSLCVIKEFWFDLKYETNPPQTIDDSILDFSGYMTGLVLGIFI
jgi:hypothetical protein